MWPARWWRTFPMGYGWARLPPSPAPERAPVADPDAVPDVVAAVLGVAPRPGVTMSTTIGEALTGRRVLVLLDNCEHVLDAVADLVESMLAGAATVKVLATSREGLGVRG